MAEIMFVGHDQGGAAMLKPVLARYVANGGAPVVVCQGPATALWRDFPVAMTVAEHDDEGWWIETLSSRRPGLLVTGTSHYSDFERNSWSAAEQCGGRSLGVIDAWVNFPDRFVRTSDRRYVQPDAVCVIDDGCRDRLVGDTRFHARVHVTGQPHLEHVLAEVDGKIGVRPPNPVPLIVFFSNPVRKGEAYLPPPYDQFTAASELVRTLEAHAPAVLLVKPHPREEFAAWEEWERSMARSPELDIDLTQRPSEELLATADGVAGITSMALIEAAILGLPAIAIQLGRRHGAQRNIGFEELPSIAIVQERAETASAVADLFRRSRRHDGAKAMQHCISAATERLLKAVEQELLGTCR